MSMTALHGLMPACCVQSRLQHIKNLLPVLSKCLTCAFKAVYLKPDIISVFFLAIN